MNEQSNRGWKITIASILIIIAGWLGYNQLDQQFGGGGELTVIYNLFGSSSNLISVPNYFVEANSTTTNSGIVADAGTVKQYAEINGINKAYLYLSAVGGTATSTMFIRTMFSFDGSNYFDYNHTTSTTMTAVTSTLILNSFNLEFDPGTATTSRIFEIPLPKANYMRLLFYGENLTTDPLDGVQAWVTLNLEQGY